MEISDLPVELQDLILSYLDGVSLARSSRVCSTWHQILAHSKYLKAWRCFCLREISLDVLLEIAGFQSLEVMDRAANSPGKEDIWFNVYKVWFRSQYAGVWPDLVNSLQGHRGAVLAVSFFDDRVLSASEDRTIQLWDSVTEKCIFIYKGHAKGVTSLALAEPGSVSSSQDIFMSGSKDHTVRVWSIQSLNCVRVLRGHNGWVNDVCTVKDWIVSASDDQTIRIWDLITGDTVHVFDDGQGRIKHLGVCHTTLISMSELGPLVFRSLERMMLYSMTWVNQGSSPAGFAGMLVRGDAAVVVTTGGAIRVLELLRDGNHQFEVLRNMGYPSIPHLKDNGLTCSSLALWGDLVAMGTTRGKVLMYHCTEPLIRELPSRCVLVQSGSQCINCLSLGDDGDGPVLITGSEDGTVRVHRWFSPHL